MIRRAVFLTRCSVTISSFLLVGCAAWTTPVPGSRPYFFSAEPREVKLFQSFAKKQETVASKCGESNSCDQVYFTRGLLGLYESREIAEKYFEKVVAIAPKSQLAASSKAWLALLQQPTPGNSSWPEAVFRAPVLAEVNTSLAVTTDRLVRDLLDQEILIQQLRASKESESETMEALQRELTDRDRKLEALLSKKDSAKTSADPVSIQTLQKQLTERDRKIEELSAQLEALKRIDQEMREKVRPIRPPLTTVPVPGPETTP